MSVVIITTCTTDEVVGKLTTSLHDVNDDIQVMTPESYLKNSNESKYLVKIFVATETLLKVIQNLGNLDTESLFQQSESEVVLIDDTGVDVLIDDKLSKIVENWSAVKRFTSDRIAQAVKIISSKIMHNAEPSFSKRYLIHPQAVPQLLESEIMIVLGDDVNQSIGKVTVHFHGRQIDASKKQTNVWMFNIEDMPPGVKIFRIMADGDDLGQNKLSVLGIDQVAQQAVTKLRDSDARNFLTDFLCLNITDFDLDLVDILAGSSCTQLVEHLLKFGDHRGYTYPTILHLCAKYGLKCTLEWCKRNTPCKSKYSIEDKNGKTAEQVAKEELPDDTFYESFQDDGTDFEDLDGSQRSRLSGGERHSTISSTASCPEMRRWSSHRTGSRDSGRSSSGSFGTQTPLRKNTQRKRLPSDPGAPLTMPEPNRGTPLTVPEPTRPYDFSKTRVERPYEEISDRDLLSTTTIYSQPWEESQLASNIHKMLAHSEDEEIDTKTSGSVTLPAATEDTKF